MKQEVIENKENEIENGFEVKVKIENKKEKVENGFGELEQESEIEFKSEIGNGFGELKQETEIEFKNEFQEFDV